MHVCNNNNLNYLLLVFLTLLFVDEVALQDIRIRRERQSWVYILGRRRKRIEYITLYKRKQNVKWVYSSIIIKCYI